MGYNTPSCLLAAVPSDCAWGARCKEAVCFNDACRVETPEQRAEVSWVLEGGREGKRRERDDPNESGEDIDGPLADLFWKGGGRLSEALPLFKDARSPAKIKNTGRRQRGLQRRARRSESGWMTAKSLLLFPLRLLSCSTLVASALLPFTAGGDDVCSEERGKGARTCRGGCLCQSSRRPELAEGAGLSAEKANEQR